MRYRTLGKWPMTISEIAFGTGDNAGVMVHGSSKQQLDLIGKALALGINLFDTSAAYGRGAAEVNLGRVLSDLDAKDALVSTKAIILPHERNRIGEKIRDSVEDSLFRLRRDRVDVLLLHNPMRARPNPQNPLITSLTPAQVFEQAFPAMVKAREQGKARFLGLACDESETASVLPVLDSGEFAMINFTYNLANPSAAMRVAGVPDTENFEGLFEAAAKHETWVAVVRPLAGGALAGGMLEQGLDGLHPLSRGYFRMLPQVHGPMLHNARHFGFLDRPGEQTLAQAAYKFILSHSQVSTVIGGFSDIAQLEEAVAALGQGDLSAGDRVGIAAVHAKGFGPTGDPAG
jgi:aryl-alcohol dehydrogenase-like predicted oxidoreductase